VSGISGRDHWRDRRVVWTLRTFEVGLDQCPAERNAQMSGCPASPSCSLVPLAVQTGAKARRLSLTALEFSAETDSPLEGTGFEPSVPLLRKVSRLLPKGDAGPISWMGSLSTGRLARRRWSAAGPLSRPSLSRRDRWFESGSLQQRVCELSVPERRTDRHENNGACANEQG